MATPTGTGASRPHKRGRRVVAAAAALSVGFGGAAVVDTLLLTPPAFADDFGPAGDGLTRLALTVPGGVTAEQVAALDALPAVDSAQALFDGSALVAGADITPEDLRAVVPGARVELSVPGEVAGLTVSDPGWQRYGWNLENTGGNAYDQQAVAGADMSAPAGWQAGTGRGMTVAIVDTGMMTDHPDLAGSLWSNPGEVCGTVDVDRNGKPGDCNGWNFYRNNADVTNAGGDNSHGTGVAAVAGARAGNGEGSAGVAPDVTIMPLVIGGGSSVDARLGAEAIRYAADNGADVVNASWGGLYQEAILTEAIAYASSKGVLVVAAAGNDSLDRDTSRVFPASIDGPNMLTVGNSTAADTVSASSAYGARTVELFAPGHKVFTAWNDGSYRLIGGTSIAAPHVAAALALYKASNPDATAAEIKTQLMDDAVRLPAFAGRSVTGGRLSLDALGNREAPVRYTFTSMTAEAGTVTPRIVAAGSAPGGAYEARLALGMEHEGAVYALTGQPVTLDGTTASTDDSGEVAFPLGARDALASLVLAPSVDLHDGRYVVTVQLFRDGAPLGLASAAPLLVGQAARDAAVDPAPTTPAPATPAPTTPAPTTPPTSPTTPTEPAPTEPTPPPGGGSAPGETPPGEGSAPGETPPGTPDPVAPGIQPETPPGATPPPTDPSAPGDGRPTQPGPDVPGGTQPGDGDPSPSTPPGQDDGSDDGSGDGAPAPQPPADGTPVPTTPSPDPTTPPTPAPDLGGRKDYPEVGPFQLTSIDPARVSTAGGTRVVISGAALPSGARVRIGATTSVLVSTAGPTQLTFTTPALVAGVYDVHVFAPDGTSSVLTGGLTYVDAEGTSPAPTTPAPTTPAPTTPGPTAPAPPDSAQAPGDGPGPGGDGSVTGPNGQRLTYSARFTSLAPAIWRMDCSTSCSGMSV
ncbi:S8 family serine peptidase [Modestobacter sp. URMC 112]